MKHVVKLPVISIVSNPYTPEFEGEKISNKYNKTKDISIELEISAPTQEEAIRFIQNKIEDIFTKGEQFPTDVFVYSVKTHEM